MIRSCCAVASLITRSLVRGLMQSGLQVAEGEKIGDVDPRSNRAHCFTISDKALAIAGGVLEAVLHASLS